MFTSATERTAFTYLIVTALIALFGGVYEIFSHGVWSGWMVYAFAFPLLGGAIPFSWMALRKKAPPRRWACRLHHAGIATFTTGSIVEGILYIYGTTNHLTRLYWLTGAALICLALAVQLIRRSSPA